MEIQSLCAAHLPQMAGLLRANYGDEKRWLPTLPEVPLPDLREIAENGLGVAAVEKNRLLGYWGASGPFSERRAGERADLYPLQRARHLAMNPNALHYWPKHFRVYTYSLTRRVDEGILGATHES